MLLQTLKNSEIIGYYPYEGVYPVAVVNYINSKNTDQYMNLLKWWDAEVKAIDKKAPPMTPRASDNKVTLYLRYNFDCYYLTFYDNQFTIHLNVSKRTMDIEDMIVTIHWK